MRTEKIDLSDVILVTEASTSDLGVSYEREVLSEEQVGEREEVEFKTRRVVANKAEAQQAKAVYSQARAKLRKLCSKTVLGLVCRLSEEPCLREVIEQIDADIAAANRSFSVCEISYTVVPIAIAHNNVRAQEALGREIRRYGERLLEAAQSHDAEAIRRVLRDGKGIETLVADEALRTSLEEMNEAARKAARVVTKSIKEHEGDEAAARASVTVRSAAEEVARRFPWASAFDVTPGASGHTPAETEAAA